MNDQKAPSATCTVAKTNPPFAAMNGSTPPSQVEAQLSGHQKKRLRALAHHLQPVVRAGQGGVSAGLVAAIDQALLDHELIKVRLYEPEDKKAMATELAKQTTSALCGLIGHTVILYRRHPKKPVIAI